MWLLVRRRCSRSAVEQGKGASIFGSADVSGEALAGFCLKLRVDISKMWVAVASERCFLTARFYWVVSSIFSNYFEVVVKGSANFTSSAGAICKLTCGMSPCLNDSSGLGSSARMTRFSGYIRTSLLGSGISSFFYFFHISLTLPYVMCWDRSRRSSVKRLTA